MVNLGKGFTTLQVINLHHHINAGAKNKVRFTVLTHKQAKIVKPVAPDHLSLITGHSDEATAVVSQLLQEEPATSDEKWFSPKTCQGPQTFNQLKRRIPDAVANFRQREKGNFRRHENSNRRSSAVSDRMTHKSPQGKKARDQNLLIKFHIVFAPHRLGLGLYNWF